MRRTLLVVPLRYRHRQLLLLQQSKNVFLKCKTSTITTTVLQQQRQHLLSRVSQQQLRYLHSERLSFNKPVKL